MRRRRVPTTRPPELKCKHVTWSAIHVSPRARQHVWQRIAQCWEAINWSQILIARLLHQAPARKLRWAGHVRAMTKAGARLGLRLSVVQLCRRRGMRIHQVPALWSLLTVRMPRLLPTRLAKCGAVSRMDSAD